LNAFGSVIVAPFQPASDLEQELLANYIGCGDELGHEFPLEHTKQVRHHRFLRWI
jgi:hypothetical protein